MCVNDNGFSQKGIENAINLLISSASKNPNLAEKASQRKDELTCLAKTASKEEILLLLQQLPTEKQKEIMDILSQIR